MVKEQLMKRFDMKDLGLLERFLGIDVSQDFEKKLITIPGKKYICRNDKRFRSP
jgi:hypothetical protein